MKLTNPYSHISKEGLHRISGWISIEDAMLLKTIRPQEGTVQLVIQHLTKYLANECRKQSITDWNDRERFERLICERFPLGGPDNDAGTKADARDVGPGTDRVRPKVKTKSAKPSDVPGNHKGGVGDKQAA